MIQSRNGTHLLGKIVYYLRIAGVLALGRHRHGQVAAYQPGYKFAVIVTKAMLFTEFPGVLGSQGGVVAFAPFTDVMEQTGQIQ